MGGCLSCRSKSSFNNIRVVHMSGYVVEFEPPITAGQITGMPTKHFLCTAGQLLSGAKPMKLDATLEPGHLYFLLPYSILRPDVSPVDMTNLVKKLSAKGNQQCDSKSQTTNFSDRFYPSSPICGSPARSFPSSPLWNSPGRSPSRVFDSEMGDMAYGARRSCGARSWKPILDPIREKSFNRRESDLQEGHP